MSRSPLRPASAPHTNKPPGACPYCGSHVITRKGVRKKKLEVVQLWRCASCKRLFTPGPAALRNKTYPIRLVLQALTLYNLGYSLGETAKRLKSKAGRAVSPTTIATLDRRAQRADHLPPPSRRSQDDLSADANHPLDQTVSSPGLRLRLSPIEAHAFTPQSAASALSSARVLS